MKNLAKRIICLMLVAVIGLAFVGCDKKTDGDPSDLSSDDYTDVIVEDGEEVDGEQTDGDDTTNSSNKPGTTSDKKPGTTSNKKPGTTSSNKPGTTTSNKPGTTTSNKPGTTSSNKPGTTSSNKPGNSSSSGKPNTTPNSEIDVTVKNMGGRTFTIAAPSWDEVDLNADWVKAIEKKYNCKFKNLNLNNDYTTLYSSIMSGNPIADIIVFNYTNFYPAVKKGFLAELKSTKDINYQDAGYFIPKAQEKLTTINGKLYGAIDTYCFRRLLVYNRNLIKGNDDLLTLYNNGQLTWDKLYEILQKVVASGKAGIAGKMYEADVLQSFILANGSTYFTRNGLNFTYTLENQNTRDAIAYVQKLYQSGCIMPMDGNNYLYPQAQFSKGRVGMMIADGWNLDYIAKNAKFDYGVVLLPSKSNPSSSLVDLTEFECYGLPASVKNIDDVQVIFAAWKQGENENGVGKQYSLTGKTDDLAAGDAAIIKKYANAYENGAGIVDYRNVLVDYYADGVSTLEAKCLYNQITAQAYLESVGAVYKANANSFNNG